MLNNLDEIRSNVETAIGIYLQSEQKQVRDIMLKAITMELKRHNITRLWCKGFKVYITKTGLGFDTTDLSLDTKCTLCGDSYKSAKTLYIYRADAEDEEHVYGCRCGHVYKINWGYVV